MHASIFKTPMSEETFQNLLDVMEKHFAALKLLDADKEYKLTRAVSFSELPSTRKIVIEQCYQPPNGPGIVRQYSCEQIFNKTANTREVKISEVVKTDNEHVRSLKTKFPHINCFKLLDWNHNFSNNSPVTKKPTENGTELMEIDAHPANVEPPKFAERNIFSPKLALMTPPKQFKESTVRSDNKQTAPCNFGQTEEEAASTKKRTYESVKLMCRPLAPIRTPAKAMEGQSSCSCCKLLFFILLPILALITAAIFNCEEFSPTLVCSHSSDFFNATVELHEKILGQRQAISALSEALIRDAPCIRTIVLLGGIGTGKSYSVDIVRKHFPRAYLIHRYYPPLTDKLNDKMFWPLTCYLVILENLSRHDLPDIVNYAKKFQDNVSYCITILAMFNTEVVNFDLKRTIELERDSQEIKNSFEKERINVDVILYDQLSEDILRKCVIATAKENGITLSQSQIEEITGNFLASGTGCKGVYSKVQLYKIGQT